MTTCPMQFCTRCNCYLKPFENQIEKDGKIEKQLWWRCSHPACTFRQKGGGNESLVFVRHYGSTTTSKYHTEYEKEFYGYLRERHGNFHDFFASYPTVNPDFPIQCSARLQKTVAVILLLCLRLRSMV